MCAALTGLWPITPPRRRDRPFKRAPAACPYSWCALAPAAFSELMDGVDVSRMADVFISPNDDRPSHDWLCGGWRARWGRSRQGSVVVSGPLDLLCLRKR